MLNFFSDIFRAKDPLPVDCDGTAIEQCFGCAGECFTSCSDECAMNCSEYTGTGACTHCDSTCRAWCQSELVRTK